MLRILLFFVTGALICIMIVFMSLNLAAQDSLQFRSYNIMTAIFFALVTITQASVIVSLYVVILKHFKGNLDREYGLLVTC